MFSFSERCVNAHPDDDQCVYWAFIGECTSNAEFMRAKCSRACSLCPGSVITPNFFYGKQYTESRRLSWCQLCRIVALMTYDTTSDDKVVMTTLGFQWYQIHLIWRRLDVNFIVTECNAKIFVNSDWFWRRFLSIIHVPGVTCEAYSQLALSLCGSCGNWKETEL